MDEFLLHMFGSGESNSQDPNINLSQGPVDRSNEWNVLQDVTVTDPTNSQDTVRSTASNVNEARANGSKVTTTSQDTVRSTASKVNKENVSLQAESTKTPTLKINENWILLGDFSLEEESIIKLNLNGKVCHHVLVQFLNRTYKEVPCVLNSFGAYKRKHNLVTLRYKCRHASCRREYKVFQMFENQFKLYHNNEEVHHEADVKIANDVNGAHRVDVGEKLKTMTAEEYLNECERNADPELTANGNLQDCIAYPTANKIRSEVLQAQDYDKDDIIDLLLMKIDQDLVGTALPTGEISNYIRRIGLDPYLVTLFSEEQFQCLKMLKTKNPDDEMVVHIDATGGVVKHGTKKVFYYSGVTPDTSLEVKSNENRKVLQLFDCISGAHSIFDICLLLMEYKYEFHKKFPNMEWPIVHAVTDFSYAILNAICLSWNTMPLIDYINCMYNALTSGTSWSEVRSKTRISTFIHICCGHLPKNHSKDVKEYFPNLDSEQQNVVKEIFAGMFGIKNIETLKKIWQQFSTLLLSKYVDETVEAALKELSKIMVNEEQHKHLDTVADDEDDQTFQQYFPEESKLPTTDNHKAIYKCSRFYQTFKSLMFQESFAVKKDSLNVFYSPQYAEMFLQRYITILPLWTCFDRHSNAYAEGNFKDTKKRIIRDTNLYGPPPLKAGRFVKLLKKRTEEVTRSIRMGNPRYRCTGQKSQSNAIKTLQGVGDESLDTDIESNISQGVGDVVGDFVGDLVGDVVGDGDLEAESNILQANVKRSSSSILSLYKLRRGTKRAANKTSTSTSSPSTKRQRTPSPGLSPSTKRQRTPSPCGIDNPNVRESWNRKTTKKFSYFEKTNLRKINKSSMKVSTILEKACRKGNTSNSLKRLPNFLIDHPATYLAPTRNFVIVKNSAAKSKLFQRDYKTLVGSSILSTEVIIYVLKLFQSQYENIQCETSVDSYQFDILKKRTLNGKISTLFFVNSAENCTLLIANCNKKTLSFVDPQRLDRSGASTHLKEFESCVKKYNSNIPHSWKVEQLDYHFEHHPSDSAVFILNLVEQYLKSGAIDATFEPVEYRTELQHRIIRSSTNMSKTCILCGTLSSGGWVRCDCCNRWSHTECIGRSEEELKEDTIHYFCIICEANSPKSDELETIFEESVEM